MSLKSFIVIVCCLIFCLAVAPAQNKKISINRNDISIKQIFTEIEKQTSYSIGYNETDLDINKRIELLALIFDLDKLLSLTLNGTGFKYSIRENHILIIPQQENVGGKYGSKVYRGCVLTDAGHNPLSYATVLLKNEDKTVAVGITDDSGLYSMTTSEPATSVQVSFVGYEIRNRSIRNDNPAFEVFYLKTDIANLAEIQTSANAGVISYIDRTSYPITKKMSESVTDAFGLLDKIPKIHPDNMKNTVKTGKDEPVLLTVNGMQQSPDYIKSIPPERILRMEVIHEPSGRFVSENYAVIVNYILKKDYTGYDVNVGNSMTVDPVGTNDNDWLVNDRPQLNFTYTKNHVTAYAHYNYDRTRLNLSHDRLIRVGGASGGQYVRTENTSVDNPNDIFRNESNHAVAGINYRITQQHAVSLQGDYTSVNSLIENRYLISNSPEHLPDDYWFKDTTTTKLKDADYKGTFFYQGDINENIQLSGDVSYNYYSDDVDNHYFRENMIDERNIFKEKKNQWAVNIEGDFRISSKSRLTAGYAGNRRKYGSTNYTGYSFIDYKESRNGLFCYLTSNLTDRLRIKAGAGFEYIDTKSIDYRNSQFIVQPHLQIDYTPNDNLNVNLSYTTNSDNPTLYQLSIMPLTLDTIVNQIGNPRLKTSVNHLFSARLSYKNRLFFKGEFKYSPQAICETAEQTAGRVYLTFNNIKTQQYSLEADYVQPFGKSFNWKSSVIYYCDKAEYEGISNTFNSWMMNAQIDYFNTDRDFGLRFGYYREMNKRIMWQGFQMVNHDKWELTAKKYFRNKQIAVMLSYIPPIDWGIRYKQERKIDSPVFLENSYVNMETYRNMLFLKVEFRFNKGKVRQDKGQSSFDGDMKDKRRLNF